MVNGLWGTGRVNDMAKHRVNKKPPSRRRYEEQHPTISVRLDKETRERLKEHLKGTGCSVADLIKDTLGREESMVEKRVGMLAARQVSSPVEHRLKCLEGLVHELISVVAIYHEWPLTCPQCENEELYWAMGTEIESTLAHPQVYTWKCAKCGFFIDTSKRIDPESIGWVNPRTGEFSSKPVTPAKRGRGKIDNKR